VKRFFFVIIIAVLTIGLGLSPAQAAKKKKDIMQTRRARHIILPLIGYQGMNGEKIDFSYNCVIHVDWAGLDSTFLSDSTISRERSVEAPMFGLIYRYRPSYDLNCDLTLAVIHDGQSWSHNVIMDVYGNSQILPISISRGNTVFGSVEIGYNLPIPIRWFGLSVNGGLGYAYREIKVHNPWVTFSTQSGTVNLNTENNDAESMLMLRFGGELVLWKQNQMVILGSLYYSQFIPTNDDTDPFGGIGWKMSFFPIWSGGK